MKKHLNKNCISCAFCLILIFSCNKYCYSESPIVSIKKSEHSLYLESNYLFYILGLSYDYTRIVNKKHGWSFSTGISTIDFKRKFIVPPNIGIPLNASYLIGKRHQFIEIGVNIRPQFFFTKDYSHHDHFNSRVILKENTNLIYIAPKIGFRYHNKNNLCFKASVGPQFKIMESDYFKYTEEVFKNYKHLESLNIQISVGFVL